MAKSIQESIIRIKNLQASHYPYPHLAVVEEIQPPAKGLMSKLRGLFSKDMTLHFLCPVDMSKVPCGNHGEGYRFRETRRWVKKMPPVLQVRQMLLCVDDSTTGMGSLQTCRDTASKKNVSRSTDGVLYMQCPSFCFARAPVPGDCSDREGGAESSGGGGCRCIGLPAGRQRGGSRDGGRPYS